MNIDFKLSIYRMIRNYICLRLFRIFMRHYNDWEAAQQLSLKPKVEPSLPGDKINYKSVEIAITAIQIRGGNSEIPLIIAIFKIIHIIKRYMLKLIPKALINCFSVYTSLKEKYPKLKYIEDILVLSLSVVTAKIAIRNKAKEFILSYDVINDKSDIDFAAVAKRLGVNLDICDFNKSFMYEALMSRDLSDRERVMAFGYWLKEFNLSSNTGGKQGLLLCIIAILVYFFLNNYGLFLEYLYVLREAVLNGEISVSMFKVIIRRLMRTGVKIPASIKQI